MESALTPADWQALGTRISFRGVNLFTLHRGQGQPLLVLHAFPTASYDFSKVLPLLENDYHLFLFDYPGFGFSDKPRRYPYSLFTYADAAQAVVDHYGLGRSAILAHDIGDSIALEILRRGTLPVNALVILNGSIVSVPFDDPVMRLTQRLLLQPLLGAAIVRLRLFNKSRFIQMFQKIFAHKLSPPELEAFWSLLHYHQGQTLYPRLLRYMLERRRHQTMWLEALRTSTAPLTLVWGQADPVAPPVVADEILKLRPDARYIRLEGIGHYPHWEAPAAVAAAVRQSIEVKN